MLQQNQALRRIAYRTLRGFEPEDFDDHELEVILTRVVRAIHGCASPMPCVTEAIRFVHEELRFWPKKGVERIAHAFKTRDGLPTRSWLVKHVPSGSSATAFAFPFAAVNTSDLLTWHGLEEGAARFATKSGAEAFLTRVLGHFENLSHVTVVPSSLEPNVAEQKAPVGYVLKAKVESGVPYVREGRATRPLEGENETDITWTSSPSRASWNTKREAMENMATMLGIEGLVEVVAMPVEKLQAAESSGS